MSTLASPLILGSQSPRHHVKHIPLNPDPPVQSDHMWRQIIHLSFPNIISNLAMYSTAVITTLCISRLNRPELLAAFGLGNLITNVFGLSIGVGLTSVLETLVAQAYGADNMHLAATHLNRSRIVVITVSIPCSIFLWFTDQLLLFMGQDDQVSALAAHFTRWNLIGLIPFFLYNCSTSHLRSCQQTKPPLIVNFIGSLLHLALSVLLINYFDLELFGAAIATSINNIVRFVLIELYFAYHPSLLGHEWTREMFTGIRHFMGLAIPSFFLVFIEWSCFELMAVIAGWVSTLALSAHVSANNVIAVAYMVPMGIAAATSALTGACLGEGRPDLAARFAVKGISLSIVISSIYGFFLFYYVEPIAHLYTADETALGILIPVIKIIAVYVVFDAINCAEAGVLRGLGKQGLGAKYQTIVMYGILLPLAFALHYEFGLAGIWLASMIGMITNAAGFAFIIWKTDFKECSRIAILEHGQYSLKISKTV